MVSTSWVPRSGNLKPRSRLTTGSRHCITVSSGTEALLISLMALDLKPGDEVITTPFTFAATAEMIVLAGAKPVFVDIEPDTCNIDASLIEAKITPRTKAIMPVSLYGQVADMAEMNAIAAKHGAGGDRRRGAELRRRLPGQALLRTVHLRRYQLLPQQAARLLRRRRRTLHRRRPPGESRTRDPRARPERALHAHPAGRGRSHGHTAMRRGAGQAVRASLGNWNAATPWAERYLRLLKCVGLLAVRPDRDCVWAQFTVFVDDRSAVQAALQAQGVPTRRALPQAVAPSTGLRRAVLPRLLPRKCEGRGAGDEPTDERRPERGRSGPRRRRASGGPWSALVARARDLPRAAVMDCVAAALAHWRARLPGSRFAGNLGSVLVANALAQVVTLCAAPVLSRLYGPEAFGAYGLFVALVGIGLAVITARVEWLVPNPRSNTQAAALFLIGPAVHRAGRSA